MIPCTEAMWSTSVEVYFLLHSLLFTHAFNSFGPSTKYLQGSAIPPPWTQTPSGAPWMIWAFIVNLNFEPDLNDCFYCISALIKFIVIVFELGIFSVINLWWISSQNPNITSCIFKQFWHKFPSNYKPSQFWNSNFPPIISPSEYISPFQK